ncbi:MAG: hypothetical protein ACTS3R_07835 [Inquilinaceae bacterium]
MTVTTSTARIAYEGTGAVVSFPVPFRFLENSHVRVLLRQAGGTEMPWAEGTDYILERSGTGGILTATVAPTVNETLVILRAVPETQEVDYVENDPFPAETHERALDKLTMIAQQLRAALGRTFTIPETDTQGGKFALPVDAARASRFLAFDALGAPIASTGTAAGQEVPFSDFGKIAVTAADAAALRTLIDLGDTPLFLRDGAPVEYELGRSDVHGPSQDLARLNFVGFDAAGAPLRYGRIKGRALSATPGFADGKIEILTLRDNVETLRLVIERGLTVGAAAGADKGAGTINAEGYFLQGAPLQAGGNCRLVKAGADLKLERFGGTFVFANGKARLIPLGGLTLVATGALAVGTDYYIYTHDDNDDGTLDALEASTTVPADDPDFGHRVKSTDASRSLVGLARTIAGPAWVDTAAQRFVRSWFNDRGVAGTNGFSSTPTASASPVAFPSPVDFLAWAGETASLSISGFTQHANPNGFCTSRVYLNGAQIPRPITINTSATGLAAVSIGLAVPTTLSEGFKRLELWGEVGGSAGTGTWRDVEIGVLTTGGGA